LLQLYFVCRHVSRTRNFHVGSSVVAAAAVELTYRELIP
jgi:hypothetical protein